MHDEYIGLAIGNYRVEAELGRGTFGGVFLVRHRFLRHRLAAMKLLPSARLDSPQDSHRFLREARFLEVLEHPHILPIYDAGIDEGIPYLVTQYAPNGSLRDLLRRYAPHPLPIRDAVTILAQVGEALHFAHSQKIIHRDLKPENILFNERGEALLADFSIAMMQKAVATHSTSRFIGTPSYMAPEQFQGVASNWSDQYALGCIAYELVTGHRPFSAPDLDRLIQKHLREKPVPPGRLNSDVPFYVEQAILKAMEKQPHNRYLDVLDFVTALQAQPTSRGFVRPSRSTLVLSSKTKDEWLDESVKYRQLKRYEEALFADEQALALDPYDARAHNSKGNSLYYLKRFEEALAAYEQALALNPNLTMTFTNKGNTLYYLKRYEEALVAYESAIELDPASALAYHGKGICLSKLVRSEEALDAFERAIQIDPHQALFYRGKSKALARLGKGVEAQWAYRRANRLERKAKDSKQ